MLVLSTNFTARYEMLFSLTEENISSWWFYCKVTRKTFLLGIFKIALRLRDRHFFTWQSLRILNVCINLTLKRFFFSKTKPFFQKIVCRFLVERTEIESVTFSYKTALPKANVNPILDGGGQIPLSQFWN